MDTLTCQKHYFGCGFACLATLLNISYDQALVLFKNGALKAKTQGLLCKEISQLLQKRGYEKSKYKYIKPRLKNSIYKNGTIVYIKRCPAYPVGHYLIRVNGKWMDPWHNFKQNNNINYAEAGFRKRLPGTVIFAIYQ